MTEEPTGYFSIFFMAPPDPQIQEIAGQYMSVSFLNDGLQPKKSLGVSLCMSAPIREEKIAFVGEFLHISIQDSPGFFLSRSRCGPLRPG